MIQPVFQNKVCAICTTTLLHILSRAFSLENAVPGHKATRSVVSSQIHLKIFLSTAHLPLVLRKCSVCPGWFLKKLWQTLQISQRLISAYHLLTMSPFGPSICSQAPLERHWMQILHPPSVSFLYFFPWEDSEKLGSIIQTELNRETVFFKNKKPEMTSTLVIKEDLCLVLVDSTLNEVL